MAPDRISTTFSALADPTRRAILARLALGETSVTALAEPFAMSLPAISRHLKVLERAGLIARGRTAQWRPCRLAAGPLKDVADWLEHYRRFWDESPHASFGVTATEEQRHGVFTGAAWPPA
jgi:DNA-binding transcriptional ArsR family regulator